MTRTFDDSRPSDAEGTHSQKRSLLLPNYTAAALARPTIAHSQLRHLVTCPQRRGIVYYVSETSIVERDLLHPHLPPRNIIKLDFSPTCFAASTVPSNSQAILLAAGGQQSQLHVSLHSFSFATSTSPPTYTPPKLLWKHNGKKEKEPKEIVNTIMFTSTSLTDDTRRPGCSDLRMIVGGNNRAVHVYDVFLQPNIKDSQRVELCGQVVLDTCVNHVSLSPSGRTLICVGDTPNVYLYHLSPGTNVTFLPIAIYELPLPPSHPSSTPSPTVPPFNFRSIACFSSAWSPDGLKFAIGSQEGQICVWDVRSASPVFQYWTPYRVNHKWRESQWENVSSGWNVASLDENGPDSGIRSVKFTGGESGRELLVWVEQTANLHVIDARTFDLGTHSIIPFPDLSHLLPPSPDPTRNTSPSESPPSQTTLSPESSTDSLLGENTSTSRTTTTGTTTTATDATTIAALSGLAEAGSVGSVRVRTPSPPPFPPLEPVSASTWVSEIESWYRPPQIALNILRNMRIPEEVHRRRERLQRQRNMMGQEHLQQPDSGSTPPVQPPVPPVPPPRDSNLGSRHMASRRDDILRQTLMQVNEGPSGALMLRILQAILASGERAEMSAEIRSLLDDTRARIAALGGEGVSGNSGGGGGELRLPSFEDDDDAENDDGVIITDQMNDNSHSRGGNEGPIQISGLCLDPTGGWIYVAGTTGLVEWRVREREEGKGGASSGWV